VELHRPGLEAKAPEGMHEGVALVLPPLELDGELDGAVGGLHDFEGVDAQRLEVAPDGGDGGLADADGADRRGFDQRDGHAEALQPVRDRRGSHPAGGAASDDDDGLDGFRLHATMFACTRAGIHFEYVCAGRSPARYAAN
jgi:hypothetical protein